MENPELHTKVKELIAQNRMVSALNTLKEHWQGSPKADDLSDIFSQYLDLSKKERQGVIDREAATTAINDIRNSLILLMDGPVEEVQKMPSETIEIPTPETPPEKPPPLPVTQPPAIKRKEVVTPPPTHKEKVEPQPIQEKKTNEFLRTIKGLNLSKRIKKSIAAGDLDQAIETGLLYIHDKDMVLLAARYNRLKRDHHRGIMNQEDYWLEVNRISLSYVEMLGHIPENREYKKRRFKKWAGLLVFILTFLDYKKLYLVGASVASTAAVVVGVNLAIENQTSNNAPTSDPTTISSPATEQRNAVEPLISETTGEATEGYGEKLPSNAIQYTDSFKANAEIINPSEFMDALEEEDLDDTRMEELDGDQILDYRGRILTTLPIDRFSETLTEVLLGSNKLTSLPPEFAKLSNLEKLDLSYNQFTSLPTEIFNLRNLKELNISGNPMKTIPPAIGQLTNLEQLDLMDLPNLKQLPSEIGNLKKLKEINLIWNKLPDDEIKKLKKLLPHCKVKTFFTE